MYVDGRKWNLNPVVFVDDSCSGGWFRGKAETTDGSVFIRRTLRVRAK